MSDKQVSTAETLIVWGNLNNNHYKIIIIYYIFFLKGWVGGSAGR